MTQSQSFLHMTSLLLGLLAVTLALSTLTPDLRSRFRDAPVLTVIDPDDVATARGQRLSVGAGTGEVATSRQRN